MLRCSKGGEYVKRNTVNGDFWKCNALNDQIWAVKIWQARKKSSTFCWSPTLLTNSPTLLTNNWKGKCTEKIS